MPDSLPHAYPFRFVDAVLERPDVAAGSAASPGGSTWEGRVSALVSANGWAGSRGPWTSPLLMAEAIAQAALLLEGGDAEVGRRGFLAGIDGFEATRSPEAGESLSVFVRLSGRFGSIAKFEGDVRSGGETIARASVLVKRGDRP